MSAPESLEKKERQPQSEADIAFVPAEIEATEAVNAVKEGHADDVDIAAQILAENVGAEGIESWSAEEDKKLMWRVDWRLVPIVGLSKSSIK